ncbi:MAG: lysophospholipid acyltransferase family protein [Acidobacteria bacterium]|nr:lysophospholipid acyltransferase family protein [Acidobacteriota bacterium]
MRAVEEPLARPVAADRPMPPHAPVGGRMRRLLGRFYVTGSFWYRFHLWGISVLPRWGVVLFTVFFTTFFFVVLRRIRRAIASNLEAPLGPCGWLTRQRRIFRTMWNFAWCQTERYEQMVTERRVEVTLEGREHFERCLEADDGMVLVTAHIGHWEVGSMTVSSEHMRHVHVVREDEMDPRAQEFVSELLVGRRRERYTVHFSEEPTRLGVTLLAALRRGEVVAVQGDRPRTGTRTQESTLFGRPIELPAGPAVLGRTAGAPLLPIFVFREGRQRARVIARPPIRVSQTQDRQRDLAEAVDRIAAEVEAAIRTDPYQWFCFRELWPKA